MARELEFTLEYWRDRADFFESILDNMRSQRLELQHYIIARLESENSDLREVLATLADTIAVQLKHRNDEIIPKDSDAALYVEAYQSRLIRLDTLYLSTRLACCLRNQNLETLGELCKYTEADVLRIPNLGRHSLKELKNVLHSHGLSLSLYGGGE
jgi:DNA-directed RNA polymerase alpha subunit